MKLLHFSRVLATRTNSQRLKILCQRSLATSGSVFKQKENQQDGLDSIIKKKYSDTLELPKSAFPMKIPHEKRTNHEVTLADKLKFDQLYGLQRLWRQDQPEFILHDGPPYANGNVHIGHAVNKVLKDITNRYKLLRGYKVNYIPGWDCHGLPIELKALKTDKNTYLKDPLQVREKAKAIVDKSIKSQKEAFKRWGVMAEWDSVYRTLDKGMLQAQLRAFYSLYTKGLVFRDLKPVYWSPSSETCLAEFELEYNQSHQSPSVYLGLELNADFNGFASALNQSVSDLKNGSVQAVIWTTTPWTLPSNKAVSFNESQEYTLLAGPLHHDKSYYIVASHLIEDFKLAVGRDYKPVFTFAGSQLANFQYRHPWFDSELCPFIHGDHVVGSKGTGLVHTAPAHGQDDFVIGLKHKLKMDCYVDNNGNFDSQIESLKGLPVLSGGNKAVISKLKPKIIKETNITHSYPYDWRTKKPVITKTSLQWFLDTEKLKSTACQELEKINVFPKNVQNTMGPMVQSRPYWCISRQRSWGVPIPVLYRKESGEPFINDSVINELCNMIETTGGLDFWWSAPVSDMVKDDILSADLVKGTDIFDIWLDSGLTWQILGDKVADVYLEGQDQFQGWFQSSLLTSVALRGKAPYKNLYVHGFVVDEEGRKMSKSAGNVVDPMAVIDGSQDKKFPALGADVLRWWVAAQGSADGSNVAVNQTLLRASDDGVQKLRNVIRFLISYCNEEAITELDVKNISYDELMHTDQYMLKLLRDFQLQVTDYYESMNYHRVLMKTLHFATTEVSSWYFTWIKDRLYCDLKQSESRKSCIFVLHQIYLTLAKVLAPILPFLIEESSGSHKLFQSLWFDVSDSSWNNSQIASMFETVIDIRTSLNHVIGANNPKDIWVELICNREIYESLQLLHPVDDGDILDKCDSELCDILQVSGVDLKCVTSENSSDSSSISNSVKFSSEPVGVSHSLAGFSLGISKTHMTQCARCRRHCCEEGSVLCVRCMSVMQRLLRKQSQDEIAANSELLKEAVGKKT
ncbi:Isoleucine--tRNA ligase, mitochondrial [Orchesella cincta]|uniref:isoleucine--tRNA ligase n=1 Tax=Orchesella cincta TaxID=48709 RepID=A0A1D2NM37_ORCCI|nr:Isoleucine--tRNA ligase, mitochondrial [Orchesella cincta]